MLAAQRQNEILRELARVGAVRISDLAANLKVSEMTVRRDLDVLAEQGLLEKVHGGAIPPLGKSSTVEPPFKANSLREEAAKETIAKLAAGLVQPGTAIALMGGSTVFAMVKHIAEIPNLTVVTNSIPISNYLHEVGYPSQNVILTGGQRTPTDSLVGELTIATFKRLNLDQAFVGAQGFSASHGFSSPNLQEAETNRAVREHTKEFVVLADATKWGIEAFGSFAELHEADTLITSPGLKESTLKSIKKQIRQVLR